MDDHDQLFRARLYNVDAIIAAGAAIERLALGHGITPLNASPFALSPKNYAPSGCYLPSARMNNLSFCSLWNCARVNWRS